MRSRNLLGMRSAREEVLMRLAAAESSASLDVSEGPLGLAASAPSGCRFILLL